nr:DUF4957 domain-containing protein [Bacteroidales bacterium]
MKNIFKSILCVIGASLLFSCEQSVEVLDTIDYTRVLTPTTFKAEVVPATGTDVILTWQKIKNAEGYELEVYNYADSTLVDAFSVEADDIPYTVYGLKVDESFYARVRGVSSELTASNWAYLENKFSTYPVRASLNPVVSTRTSSSISLSWDDASDKADLSKVVVEPVLASETETPVEVELTADQISAAAATIDGLDAGREYRFTLVFGKAGNRGSVTAFTRPNIDGTPTTITSAAALLSAIDNQSGTIKLVLDYSDTPYEVTSLYPDATKKFATVVGDVYIYGNATDAGKKPTVKGLVFNLNSGATVLHLEDLVLDGDGEGYIINNISAEMTAIEIVNSEMTGSSKGIYSVTSSGSATKAQSFLIDGSYCHDINADGSVGGDFIDIRAGEGSNITIQNSTFYSCARTFIRVSDNAKNQGDILVQNCTFNYVTATPSSSNNAGIFHVRVTSGVTSIKANNNVFLNEYHDNEGETADKGWVRMCRNSSDSYRAVCSGNVYYNVGVAWWTTGSVATSTDSIGDKAFEEIAKTDATILEEDPCVNSAAGKLYLKGTAGEQIKTLKAGDPRWWDAVQPVVIRETELTAVESDYTWDFTEKTIYDTEELTANTIIGNARIYATSTVPANVVMSKGIDFSTAASVSPEGVPSYSAVEILTSGYGAVKVMGTSEDGLGTIQVLAGGDRYPVLADGEEHTILLGDLSGENSIYVLANSALTLKTVTWTKDLTADSTVETLATPTLTVTPNKLDEGTAEDVVIAWKSVTNAADYVLTFNGVETVLSETSYTVAAADVAALAVGEYPVTVKARPVSTSSKYVESAVAEEKLTIKAVVVGDQEVTLTWDFTADNFSGTCAVNKIYKYDAGTITEVGADTEKASLSFSDETLYFLNGDKQIKSAGSKSCSADSQTYRPITIGGASAY